MVHDKVIQHIRNICLSLLQDAYFSASTIFYSATVWKLTVLIIYLLTFLLHIKVSYNHG